MTRWAHWLLAARALGAPRGAHLDAGQLVGGAAGQLVGGAAGAARGTFANSPEAAFSRLHQLLFVADHGALTQVFVGDEQLVQWTIPLVTALAQFATNDVVVESELSKALEVLVLLEGRLRLWLVSGLVRGMGPQYSLSFGTLQTMTCRVSSGGRVQLQMTMSMAHFGDAKHRTFVKKKGLFWLQATDWEAGPWEDIYSEVGGRSVKGLLMHGVGRLVQRCVTDEQLFA